MNSFSWTEIDWSKTNKQISLELGLRIQTVSENRRRLFPRPVASDEQVFAEYPEYRKLLDLVNNNKLKEFIESNPPREEMGCLFCYADSLLAQTKVCEESVKSRFKALKYTVGKRLAKIHKSAAEIVPSSG